MTSTDTSAVCSCELAEWPTKDRMVEILLDAGHTPYIGPYSVRIEECSHFVYQAYADGSDRPDIDADAGSVETLMEEAKLVSVALAEAQTRHRFEIYDYEDNLAGYLHHDWPQ